MIKHSLITKTWWRCWLIAMLMLTKLTIVTGRRFALLHWYETWILVARNSHSFFFFFVSISIFVSQKHGNVAVTSTLLCAGANLDIVSKKDGTAREMAERSRHVEVVLAIDRYKCRKSLVELCIGMHANDFPVLIVLEIHRTFCAISGLHEAQLGPKKQWRMLDGGHLKRSVAWEIAKKVKHYLN